MCGEMSRIMLAFKSLLTKQVDIDTLIFDEIDTGIGGLVLGQVAKKLKEIAKHQQILCVTHAPAIAAAADGHLFIEKRVVDGITLTHAHALQTEEEVLEELSRMLGGHERWHKESAEALRKSMYNTNC